MNTPESSTPTSSDSSLISDYELWAAQNWVHTPGTLDAQLHARAKFEEEIDELIEAISLEDTHDITSEAGDVLWTATASGYNTDISLRQSLQASYPDYFLDDSVTVQQIDTLALEVFSGSSADDIRESLKHYKIGLGKMAKQWFVLKDAAQTPAETFADAWIGVKRERAVHNLANTALIVSFIAQRFADADLQQVIDMNRKKLDQRLHSGSAITKLPKN